MTVHPHALFGVDDYAWRGKARTTDPDTSHAAAREITGRTERAILAVFDSWWDGRPNRLTDQQLCAAFPNLYAPTVKSARSRLTKQGILVDSGERRPSSRGRPMIVWKLATTGREPMSDETTGPKEQYPR